MAKIEIKLCKLPEISRQSYGNWLWELWWHDENLERRIHLTSKTGFMTRDAAEVAAKTYLEDAFRSLWVSATVDPPLTLFRSLDAVAHSPPTSGAVAACPAEIPKKSD